MNKSYSKTISVEATAERAFGDIQNLRGWWNEGIDGNTDQLNEGFFYYYKDIHLCKMKMIEAVPDKKLVYEVIENEFNFIADKTEWVGTKLIFEMSSEGDKTKVKFTHEGLTPNDECYDVCNDAWNGYISSSLKNYIETGKGKPNPKEGEGFNAELDARWGLSEKR
jgi:hypothetical protein